MIDKKPALFLDRDGVINIDHGYVYLPEQVEFVAGIFDLCLKAIECGYLVFVVTNQAGIGRGYYTEQQFDDFTEWMCEQFLLRGIKIAQVYFCPFHPDYGLGQYKRESFYRKPQPGMILQAAREHEVDLSSSLLVGDKESDMQAGLAAGVGCNILYVAVKVIDPTLQGIKVVSCLEEVKKYL
ncbi:MAG: HAD family hydrolase [Methylococcaceae bacterium]|nr:HAD family hydrolase [Methylococcaceae bacterium]